MNALTNNDRAERAHLAIDAYGDDIPESNLIDLLADAMHWCEQEELNFKRLLQMASQHYLCELIDADGNERRRS